MRPRRRAAGDLLLSGLQRLAEMSPTSAYEIAAVVDRLRRENRPGDPDRLRNLSLTAAIRSSSARAFPQVVGSPMTSLPEPPAVLVMFHTGPWRAIGWLGLQGRGRLFTLTYLKMRHARGSTQFPIGDDAARRTLGMKVAFDTLRSRRYVLLALDDGRSSTLPVTMFARTLELARGPFALARLAPAPVVPVAAHWRGAKIEYAIGEPIQPAAEQVMADAVGRWFEDYLSRYPF